MHKHRLVRFVTALSAPLLRPASVCALRPTAASFETKYLRQLAMVAGGGGGGGAKPTSADNLISKKGAFTRSASAHRSFVEPGGAFEPEAGRYHLHVSLACPWACGTLSMLFLKGLEDCISYSVVHPTWQRTRPDDADDAHCGWVYRQPGDPPLANPLGHGANACDDRLVPDMATHCKSIRDVYQLGGDPKGPFTTPVLWDKKTGQIVNNESVEILKMLNAAFDAHAKCPAVDIFPEGGKEELQTLNDELVYPRVNNGVYRSGFARSQEAYDEAVASLFGGLDELEEILGTKRFLGGDRFTWVDLRLFHTLARFDPVYTCYFKTNIHRISDYPNLLAYMRDIHAIEPVARSIDMRHIKTHYYTSHPHLNTYGVIPAYDGPDLTVASGRGAVPAAECLFGSAAKAAPLAA